MEVKQPPRLLVFPKGCSLDSRICTLPHPRTATPSQYLFDPAKGVYEMTLIEAPRGACRSWLVASQQHPVHAVSLAVEQIDCMRTTTVKHGSSDKQGQSYRPISDGYIMSKAHMLLSTPMDLLFLILPALSDQSSTKPSARQLFLSSDDLLEKVSNDSKHFEFLLSHEPTRGAVEIRMQAICDSVDAGDEKMYRLNELKLLLELVSKARRIVDSGLPASMEAKFVKEALEVPLIGMQHDESISLEENPTQSGTPFSEISSLDSQASTATTSSVNSATSINTDITIPNDVISRSVHDLQRLLRVRTVLAYMISSYVPTTLAANLFKLIASEKSPINFKPLDERLAEVTKIRAEALAARSMGDFSRKRNAYEEDEAAELRAEKKRKKEEEEKQKKLESRAIRDLKKVDTTGMKKLSDLFRKRAATKK